MKMLLLLIAASLFFGCSSASLASAPADPPADPPGHLVVVTTSLPVAYEERSYATQLVAAGGKPPYTWSLNSGNLPQGLLLNSSGLLQGVPLQTGNFDFVVEVKDGVKNSAKLEIKSNIERKIS